MMTLQKNQVENYIIREFDACKLPSELTDLMFDLVEPIVTELIQWGQFHKRYLSIPCENYDLHIFEQICWTILGTVDYKKTAVNLIRNEILDPLNHYKLASLYCLEDYIPILWENLPEESKRNFYSEEGPSTPELEFCWPYILKGEETKLDKMSEKSSGNTTTFNQHEFEYSALRGNIEATKYFFRRLETDERGDLLLRTAKALLNDRRFYLDGLPFRKRFDVFYYLLSRMSPKMQMEILSGQAIDVLEVFLDWPWQHLFLGIVEHIWGILSDNDFNSILEMILRHIIIEMLGDFQLSCNRYLLKILQGVFERCNTDSQKDFVDNNFYEIDKNSLAHFKIQDSEIIKLIFRKKDSAERKKFAFSETALQMFFKLMRKKERFLFKFCLEELALTDKDKEELKEAFSQYLIQINADDFIRNSIWKQFCESIDEIKT